jgi:hypothetical protein
MTASQRRMRKHAIGILVLVTLTGCGSSAGGDAKFTQTWPTPYEQTTCAQWLGDMTEAQKFTAAADMQVGAQSTDAKNADLPEDDLINSFAGDITQGCEPIATMTITDAAISIYLIGRNQYSP